MTTPQLTAEIFRQLSLIAEDESKLQRAIKALKRITAPKPDPTLMTREEFVARVKEAEKGPRRSFSSAKELDNYIRSL